MADNSQNSQTTQNKKENLRDNVALIIGTLFLLGLTFLAYNQFNKSDTDNRAETGDQTAIEKIKEAISSSTEREEEEADELANAVSEETEQQTPDAAATNPVGTSMGNNGMTTEENSRGAYLGWTANDYQQGDIQAGDYTVVEGDTLWEISEAVYGNGSQWTVILDANASNVGYLANGQQALITTGQALTIPASQ